MFKSWCHVKLIFSFQAVLFLKCLAISKIICLQIDVLEDSVISNVIILDTVLNEVSSYYSSSE